VTVTLQPGQNRTYTFTAKGIAPCGDKTVTVNVGCLSSTTYGCNSNGMCVVDPNGSYTSSNCNNACVPPTKYGCNSNGMCVVDANGSYTSSNCNNACVPPTKYGCNSNGMCVVDANGSYTGSNCNNACVAICTNPVALTVNAPVTVTSTQVTITGTVAGNYTTVTVNNTTVAVSSTGYFQALIGLVAGQNTVTVIANGKSPCTSVTKTITIGCNPGCQNPVTNSDFTGSTVVSGNSVTFNGTYNVNKISTLTLNVNNTTYPITL
jgi:hypothetical protein